MNVFESMVPQLQSEGARWVVTVPSVWGRVQRFVCQTEGHARRFFAMFERAMTRQALGLPQR